jgi:threonine dehydrogenase-like Zn-dependent dehydrogenase
MAISAGVSKRGFSIIPVVGIRKGIAAIEIAKAEGAVSIATTRTSKKKAQLLEAGADHVIVTDEEDLVARTKEITAGKGVRISFDPIGGPGLVSLGKRPPHLELFSSMGRALPSRPSTHFFRRLQSP